MYRIYQFFHFPTHAANTEFAKLLWLIRLRWLAVFLFFALSIPALFAGLLSRDSVAKYLGVVALLFVYNLLNQFVLSDSKRTIRPLHVGFQMAIDLVVLTILLRMTGGFGNPLVALFLLHAALGGLLLEGRYSWPYLLLTHAALGYLQLELTELNTDGIEPRWMATFALYHFLVFTFWLVMRSLGAHFELQHESQTRAQAALETQDRLRAIGALAAGFSHEFASPLNTAKIRLERLSRTQQSEDVTEALASVHACETVIHQMNSAQLDRREYRFKKVVILDLIRDVVDAWREEHPEVEVRINATNAGTCSLPPINFAQVLLNLLDNAFEAAPDKKIGLRIKESNGRIDLEVSDQGPGFPLDVLRRLGEPFVTTRTHGTGLGLYVSQLFCQSLGGQLQIENSSEGALVRLLWPKNGELA